MPLIQGTVQNVRIDKQDERDPVRVAEVTFTVAGVYDQAAGIQLANVPTLIQNSVRNGKTVTLRGACLASAARKDANPALLMGLAAVVVSGANVNANITESATPGFVEPTTQLAAGATPAQTYPFGIFVSYVES